MRLCSLNSLQGPKVFGKKVGLVKSFLLPSSVASSFQIPYSSFPEVGQEQGQHSGPFPKHWRKLRRPVAVPGVTSCEVRQWPEEKVPRAAQAWTLPARTALVSEQHAPSKGVPFLGFGARPIAAFQVLWGRGNNAAAGQACAWLAKAASWRSEKEGAQRREEAAPCR